MTLSLRRVVTLASLIALVPFRGVGQTASRLAEFEVVDVKVNASGEQPVQARILPGGQLSVRNMPMRQLIVQAYKAADVAGGPDWLDSERYDIVAKAPPNTSEDMLRLMLQSLLSERFKLAIHREQKIMSVYALVTAKGPLKLRSSVPSAGEPTCRPSQGADGLNHTVCTNFTMAELATWLSTRIAPSFIDRPIVDLTGLKGAYDLRLDWVPQKLVGNAADSTDAPGGPTVFEALEKQLGVKLEQRKLPMPVIVVDHIDRAPTEN